MPSSFGAIHIGINLNEAHLPAPDFPRPLVHIFGNKTTGTYFWE
jgi:hypothetical protein